jgi:site-specific recombinase XerD
MTQEITKNLLPKFIDNLKEKGRSPSTILAYRSDLEQLVEFLTKNNKGTPDQIVSGDLDTFRDSLLAQLFSTNHLKNVLTAFNFLETDFGVNF